MECCDLACSCIRWYAYAVAKTVLNLLIIYRIITTSKISQKINQLGPMPFLDKITC